MAKYDVTWGGLDSAGREGMWQPDKWVRVLQILAEHNSESFRDLNSSMYDELERDFPEDDWRSEGRSLFRDYPNAWTKTGVVNFEDGVILITELGRQVLSEKISQIDVIKRALKLHKEGDEYPFSVLASAFLRATQPLSIGELYHGVMRNFRPGEDDLERALDSMERTGPNMRRLRHMMKLLELAGAVVRDGRRWVAGERSLLRELAAQPILAVSTTELDAIRQLVQAFGSNLAAAGLVYEQNLLARFCSSLLAKPFAILTGLSGSGKTRLALTFAKWISEPSQAQRQYEVVAVGADWTSNEQVLGYADALDKGKYVRTKALELLLRAKQEPEVPHFLILDEMNLSHVERYFADVLSAIESSEPIFLHAETEPLDQVPAEIELPKNLFVIGTVNVDETTYMFSPKVLDRANTIEFRVTAEQIEEFIDGKISLSEPLSIDNCGLEYGSTFVKAAKAHVGLDNSTTDMLQAEIMLFFEVLETHGAEFAFRTVEEVFRFVGYYMAILEPGADSFIGALDAQVLQKLLPRLNGSRSKLEPILWSMSALCATQRQWDNGKIANRNDIVQKAKDAASRGDESLHPANWKANGEYLRLSCEKIERMQRLLEQNGFASFAEA